MEAFDVGFERRLIVFNSEEVVRLLVLDHITGGLCLGMQGVGGDYPTRQGQGVEQGLHRSLLTRLVGHLHLIEDHMARVPERGDQLPGWPAAPILRSP